MIPQIAQRAKPLSPLENALNLAAQGFNVFPLTADKTPAIKKWQIDATTAAEQVKTWWRAHPAANAGICTTTYNGQHLCVIDIDMKHGVNGLDELMRLADEHGGDIPTTRTVSTTTGGMHLYFLAPYPIKNSAGHLAPGIDTRGERGYVVAPGSVLNGKSYELGDPAAPIAELPEWLLQILPRAGEPQDHTADVVQFPVPADLPHNVKRAVDYLENHAPLAYEGAGGDSTAYAVACRLKDLGLSASMALDVLCEHWNDRCSPPWTPDELEIKVANAYRYGTEAPGAATPEAQFEPLPNTEEEETPQPKTPPRRGLSFKLFRNITPSFEQTGLVRGYLDRGAMSVCYGESNSGKTFFVLDLAFHVAMGREWDGRHVEQGAVVYVAAEGGRGIEQRIQALKIHHGLHDVDVPLALVACPVDLLSPAADAAALIELVRDVEQQTGQPVALIVIDTLARAMAGGDENAFKDMSAFVANVDRLRNETGAHVSIIHHSGKDTSRGARGHSSLRAATDTEIEISNNTATITKQRDQEMARPIGFRLQPVEIGTGSDGATIMSCVVVHQSPTAAGDFARKEPTGNAAVALGVLERLIKTEGETAPEAHPFMQGHAAVRAERWKEAYLSGQTTMSGHKKPDTLRKQFERASDTLIALGHIHVERGFVSVLP